MTRVSDAARGQPAYGSVFPGPSTIGASAYFQFRLPLRWACTRRGVAAPRPAGPHAYYTRVTCARIRPWLGESVSARRDYETTIMRVTRRSVGPSRADAQWQRRPQPCGRPAA